jgi:hypothetical protein
MDIKNVRRKIILGLIKSDRRNYKIILIKFHELDKENKWYPEPELNRHSIAAGGF